MKCTVCNKNNAVEHPIYGILACDECRERQRQERDKLGYHKGIQSKLEYAATPFWRHMGLKAKPHEKAMEKEMKRRGLSYRDVQLINRSGGNFDSTSIKNKLEKGTLKGDKKAIGYGSERVTR